MPVANEPSLPPAEITPPAAGETVPSGEIRPIAALKPTQVSLLRHCLPPLPASATYSVPSGARASPRGLFRPVAKTVVAAWAGTAAAPMARVARPADMRVVRSVKMRLLARGRGWTAPGYLSARFRDHEERGHENQQHRCVA